MTQEQEQSDSYYLSEYQKRQAWGLATSIDLKDCNLDKMKDADYN